MNHNNFCNNVYLLMKRNNLTQQELALKALVSQSEISKIINGRLNPSLKTVIKLVQAFDVSFEKLCSETLELIIKQFPKDYEVRITEIASEALKDIESNSRAIEIGKDLSEFKIRKLESKLAKAKEALQVYADDDVIGTVARKALKQVKTCHHPYDGNMCMNAKPGDKCPECGMNGYND